MTDQGPGEAREDHLTTLIRDKSIKEFKKHLAELEENGVTVDTWGDEDRSPLAIACGCGRYDIAKLLLKNGAWVDMQRVKGGQTALMSASQARHCKVAKLLLKNGAQIDALKDKDGWSALMFASHEGNAGSCWIMVLMWTYNQSNGNQL